MINFDAVDFSERRSREVMFLLNQQWSENNVIKPADVSSDYSLSTKYGEFDQVCKIDRF